ncbi:MAG: ABC transporter permease [Acidimicrobiales bacterium]
MWANKRRLVGTVFGVFLGVAFLSGALVLGDTLSSNFDRLFSDANAGTDAVVRRASDVDTQSAAGRGLLDQSLLGAVAGVEGVAAAEPAVEGYGQLIGSDGKAIGGNGPPTLAGNWIDDPELNPYRIVEGRAPRSGLEVVVNQAAADKGKFGLGDTVTLQTPEPVEVSVVGLTAFGTARGSAGVTYTAFTLEGAQEHVIKQPGKLTSISVRGRRGVSQAELVRSIRPVLEEGTEAITGDELVKEQTDDVNGGFLTVFRALLLVFAGVALLVATFSIYNTFSILVAQRTRESALLRAVGASRRQVMASVVAEAALVAVIASVAGLFGGLGVAGLLKGLFDSFGLALPAGGLVFEASTVVAALVVGVLVTLLAAVAPAMRASRVPPLAALRDVALDRTGTSRTRTLAGLVVTGLGVAAVLSAVGGGDNVLPRAGFGAVLTIVGIVVLGPVVARPVTSVLGWPLPRLKGMTGSLARENAMRNPRRTAGTAAALMVGVGVVTLFTVFAASVKATVDKSISRSFGGDLVLNSNRFDGGGFSPQLTAGIARLPEVEAALGIGIGAVVVDGGTKQLTVADIAPLGKVLDLEIASGSLSDVGAGGLAVAADVAKENGWKVGTVLPTTFPDGVTTPLRVGAVYGSSDLVGNYVLSREAWAPHAVQQVDAAVLVGLADGVSLAAGKAAVERVAEPFGAPEVQDREEYVKSAAQGVNQALGLIYVLLALAIVIALMGIANTLALSVHERTRELGLLRAVGQTRRQMRSMVRWESVVIASFGSVGGLGLGVFLGWALVQAAGEDIVAFSVPAGQLVLVLFVGAVAGVLAAIRPARRAARLNVLTAIAAP